MNTVTLASRAVIAAYAKQVLRPIEIGAIIILVIGLIGSAYLISAVSPWWWLLMIVVAAYGIIGSVIWLILHFTISRIEPLQTAPQKRAVKEFIDKLSAVQDTLGMTKFGLLLRIIRSVMSKQPAHAIGQFVDESRDLKASFESVIKAFE